MRNLALPLTALAAAASTFAAPAVAREVDRQEVAEEFAPGIIQQRKEYCRDTELFTLADGTEYRACVNWRAQNRTRVVRSYAALDGPDEDSDANLSAARDCFDLAIASQNDPSRDSFNKDGFLAGAKAAFAACASLRQLLRINEYSLRIYDKRVWIGGR